MTPDERDPVVKRFLEGLEVPAPPPQLRARVLRTAQKKQAGTVDVWTRIWSHRGLRFAWAAAVVLLLAGHVVVGTRNGLGINLTDPGLVAENRVDEHLVEFLRPMRISDNVQPIVGMFSASGDPSDLDVKGNPS